jgi:hypothetical protein
MGSLGFVVTGKACSLGAWFECPLNHPVDMIAGGMAVAYTLGMAFLAAGFQCRLVVLASRGRGVMT